MQQVKIDAIYFNTKNKEGQPLTNKSGEPYSMINIKSGDKTYSLYIGKFNKGDWDTCNDWKAGDTKELVIEQNGQYWNFKLPRPTDIKFHDLEKRIEALENMTPKKTMKEEAEEIFGGERPSADDLPF